MKRNVPYFYVPWPKSYIYVNDVLITFTTNIKARIGSKSHYFFIGCHCINNNNKNVVVRKETLTKNKIKMTIGNFFRTLLRKVFSFLFLFPEKNKSTFSIIEKM